jgi:hypothetical protein
MRRAEKCMQKISLNIHSVFIKVDPFLQRGLKLPAVAVFENRDQGLQGNDFIITFFA